MISLDADKRKALVAAKARVRELLKPEREQARIRRAKARTKREKVRDEAAGRPADDGFMAWQHAEGLACIACLIEGPPRADSLNGQPNPIEVAHQRRNSADASWQGNRLGKRVRDAQSCPLCWWHHQGAPNACDKGQAKFWDRLGVDVVAYTRALFSAFRDGRPGQPVVLQFARPSNRSLPSEVAKT